MAVCANSSDPKKELVILLLGETGCGKSTFINSLCNYLVHESMDEAAEDVKVVIKSKYHEFDSNSQEMRTIVLGETDQNEAENSTQSGTQRCRCHVFDQGQFVLKIIDTPGIGDTRGVAADKLNLQNLLNFIAQYKELNAICILMKPNQTKVNLQFKYCLVEMLKFLNKNAADNLIFVFSNCRGTNYELGDTGAALMEVLNQIKETSPHVDIDPKNRDIKYFFDNEAFRFLQKVSNIVDVNENSERQYQESWERSVKECERLFQHINKLKPLQVLDTISINNVQTSVKLLTKPLIEINENIARNITLCENHKKDIEEFDGDLKELMDKLYIPVEDLEHIPLDYPMSVCGDRECCEYITVNGVTKINYKQICHEQCYLTGDDHSINGNTGLLECRAFYRCTKFGKPGWYNASWIFKDQPQDIQYNKDHTKAWMQLYDQDRSEKCFECGHTYQTHLHIRYKTRVVSKLKDESVQQKITNNTEAKIAQEEVVEKLRQRIDDMTDEKQKITDCLVRFSHFWQNNSITTFNDVLEDYLHHLINNGHGDQKELSQMIDEYNVEKKSFEQTLTEHTIDDPLVSPELVHSCVEELYQLNFSGPKIRDGMVLQHISVKQESHVREVKHNIGKPRKHVGNRWNKLLNFKIIILILIIIAIIIIGFLFY